MILLTNITSNRKKVPHPIDPANLQNKHLIFKFSKDGYLSVFRDLFLK